MSKEYTVTGDIMFRIRAKNEDEAQQRASDVLDTVEVTSKAKYLDVESVTCEVQNVEEEEA